MWHHCKFMRDIFSKATQSFGFIKPNAIRKLVCKVKYISEIKRGLNMFFSEIPE